MNFNHLGLEDSLDSHFEVNKLFHDWSLGRCTSSKSRAHCSKRSWRLEMNRYELLKTFDRFYEKLIISKDKSTH